MVSFREAPDTLGDPVGSFPEAGPQQLPEANTDQESESEDRSFDNGSRDRRTGDVRQSIDDPGRVAGQGQNRVNYPGNGSQSRPEIRLRRTTDEPGEPSTIPVRAADQRRSILNPSMSQSMKRRQKGPGVPRPPSPLVPPEVEGYRDNVNRLASVLSHYRNVATEDTRHAWGARIVIHDRLKFAQTEVTKRKELWKDYISAPPYLHFSTLLKKVPGNCSQRIIFVEDLNPSLVDFLGATFQIPPHVFEEHLTGSGYIKTLDNNDSTKSWQTRSSAQGYSSVTWYRPALPLVPLTPRFRKRLIADGKPSVRCPFIDCGLEHNIKLETSANIWRGNLDLCPRPGVYHRGSETEYPVGWEERATIWTRDFGHCKFVILLLDPLPGADVHTGRTTHQRNGRRQQPGLTSRLPNAQVRTRLRSSRPVEPSQYSHHVEAHDAQASPPLLPANIVPADHEDNFPANVTASLEPQLTRDPGLSSSLPVRASPLPHPAGLNTRPNTHQSRTTGAKTNNLQSEFSPAALRRRATRPGMEAISTSSEHDVEDSPKRRGRKSSLDQPQHSRFLPEDIPFEINQRHETASNAATQGTETVSHGPFIPYHPIKARLSSSSTVGDTFTDLNIRAYVKSLQIPTSTLDEFEYFLKLPEKGKENVYDPFRALFRVIHDDTQSLIDIIRISLQSIREGTMDEDMMQTHVTFWRNLLHRLNFSLAEVDQRLRAFVQFTYDLEMLSLTVDQRKELSSENLTNDTRQALKTCVDLLDRTSNSLLAEMQIVDSRRSIAEAESVSKLTELAFVFIPLSFVASLFSMQVFELEGGAPLYLFVVVAIAFVLLAYLVRLSIRSSRLIEYKGKVLLRLRDESHIQYNQPIPTHTFLVWSGKTLAGSAWKYIGGVLAVSTPTILGAAVIAALISPIISLWLRGINKGFAAVITVLLLSLDAVLIYPFVSIASGKIALNVMDILRELQKRNKTNKKLKKKARRRMKGKASQDPEALELESSDASDEGDRISDPGS